MAMRAVRYLGPGRPFEMQSVEVPKPGPGQVLLRIAACGMCHTELHFRDGLLNLGKSGFTMGHEIAGTVEALGPDTAGITVGERVLVYYYEGCGRCEYCRSGDEHLCPACVGQPGFTTDGGYADMMVVRARNCVPVPAHVSLAEIAPMGCAGTTAVHAGKMAEIAPGDWVVVHGAGGVGLALAQYAKVAGGRVIAIGLGAERLALAASLGAEHVIDAAVEKDVAARVIELTGGGADVVFELVGIAATMKASVAMLRRRGRYVLIGYSADRLDIHPVEILVREIKVLGSVGSTLQDAYDIVDLVARGAVKSVIDRSLPLDRYEEGLAALEAGATLGRIVLQP